MQLVTYKRVRVALSDTDGVRVVLKVPLRGFCLVEPSGTRSVFSGEYGLMVTNNGTADGQVALFTVYAETPAANVCDQLIS